MKRIIATIFAFTFLFSSLALAQDRPRRSRGKRHQRMQQKAAELGISPATMAAIKQAMQQARPQARALRKNLRQTVLIHGKASPQAVDARQAMKAHRRSTLKQVRGMLTPRQFKAIKRMLKKRRPPLHRVVRKHAAQLGVSEATVQAMQAEAKTTRAKMRLQRQTLQQAVLTHGRGSQQARQAKAQLRAQRKASRKAMRAYLTDEQVKTLRGIVKAKRKARRAKRARL